MATRPKRETDSTIMDVQEWLQQQFDKLDREHGLIFKKLDSIERTISDKIRKQLDDAAAHSVVIPPNGRSHRAIRRYQHKMLGIQRRNKMPTQLVNTGGHYPKGYPECRDLSNKQLHPSVMRATDEITEEQSQVFKIVTTLPARRWPRIILRGTLARGLAVFALPDGRRSQVGQRPRGLRPGRGRVPAIRGCAQLKSD
jgi:hypothetical protein